MLKNEKAFTLIEMLIVLAIITTLLVLVVPNLSGQNEQINEIGDKALVQMANNQVQAYYIDKGEYPTEIEDLVNENYLVTIEDNNGNVKLIFKPETSNPPVVIINDGQ